MQLCNVYTQDLLYGVMNINRKCSSFYTQYGCRIKTENSDKISTFTKEYKKKNKQEMCSQEYEV